MLRRREQTLWTQQTVALSGISAVKAAGLSLLGHLFAFSNIQRVATLAAGAADQVTKWGYNISANVLQPAGKHIAQIPGNIQNWAEYITGSGAYGGFGSRGGHWISPTEFVGPKPGEWVGLPSRLP